MGMFSPHMFCVNVLLCSFRSQGFSRFASLSGVVPLKLVWGIVRPFLGFEHVRALWHVDRGLS